MAKIHLHTPDAPSPETVGIEPGEALLVGRAPEPSAVPLAARSVVVASGLVSGNHVLVRADEKGVHARDLQSKNGTWLRLLPEAEVSLRGASEAHLFLASLRAPPRAAPPDVEMIDDGAAAFAERVRSAVAGWLEQQVLRLEVRVVTGAPEGSDILVPLVERLSLQVGSESGGRTEADWDAVKSRLFRYAFEQRARWLGVRAVLSGRTLAFAAPRGQRALREVIEAARAGAPLVLRGETGTGKSELAAVYAECAEGHAARPFHTVHCAHLDPPLAHAQLFGALKGSYTSSDRTLPGAVKLADGGVLFLDDVDLLPLETQAKLLRFLDHGEYEPLGFGQAEPLVADVRVVAGTNADLRKAVREKRFREDLYWRLHAGAAVQVPPLRERPEDIEQLLVQSGARARLDGAAANFLVNGHPWRGNFRECLRFCARVASEPASRGSIDRRRCEEILAEASLEESAPGEASSPPVAQDQMAFSRALEQALSLWSRIEGAPPQSFEDLGRFCETYLKSAFVAHAMALAGAGERPVSFDRELRRRLGCDLSTLKRKLDDYFALARAGS